jgi:glycosyltransferase involved in cell wall biosynthesis
VPPGDDRALAAALSALARDAGLRGRLGGAALALAPTYTWERRAERLEQALTEAVAT